jgi:hypothetical protein
MYRCFLYYFFVFNAVKKHFIYEYKTKGGRKIWEDTAVVLAVAEEVVVALVAVGAVVVLEREHQIVLLGVVIDDLIIVEVDL